MIQAWPDVQADGMLNYSKLSRTHRNRPQPWITPGELNGGIVAEAASGAGDEYGFRHECLLNEQKG